MTYKSEVSKHVVISQDILNALTDKVTAIRESDPTTYHAIMNDLSAINNNSPSTISNPGDVAALLLSDLANLDQEHFVVLSLDIKNRVLSKDTLYIGTINRSNVRIAEIFKLALKNGAANIIIAHNHPSGEPTPSPTDIHLTRQVIEAGNLLEIKLLDHIVIGKEGYQSIKLNNPHIF